MTAVTGARRAIRRTTGPQLALAAVLLAGSACGGKAEERTTTPEVEEVDDSVLLDREGRLEASDLQMGPSYSDHYEIAVDAGDRVAVEVRSTEFDPLLEVTAPGAEPLVNDDWQGDRTRSRVELVAERDGIVKVRVTSYGPAETGAYRVRADRTTAPTDPESVAAEAEEVLVLAPGRSVRGRVAEGDARLDDGAWYDRLSVEVPAEGAYELRVTPDDGAGARVEVMNPDGRALGPTGEGVFTLVEPGVHRAIVAAPPGGGPMGYEAEVRAAERTTPRLARDHHQLPSEAGSARIEIGQRVDGSLGEGDSALPTGELADIYELAGRAGTPIGIELTSDDVDPYLILIGPDGRHWENDDAGGELDSALAVTLPTDGSYRVVATTYRGGESGAYALKVMREQRAVGGADTAPPAVEPTQTPTPTTAPAGPTRRAGDLAEGDEQLRSGEFFDTYTFDLRAGSRVQVRATSEEIDTYLIVRTPSGRQTSNDDVEPGITNSLVDLRVTESGPHTVLVTSYEPGETGVYELVVEQAAGAPSTVTTPDPTPPPTGARVVTGELASGDSQIRSGEFVDEHTYEWPAGQHVRLEARSSQFDTYLMVRGPGDFSEDNDDQRPGNTNAALDLVVPAAGSYRVLVTSYRPGEQGAYQLFVTAPDTGSATDGGGDDGGDTPTASAGEEIRGELAASDPTLESGEHTDRVTLRLEPGHTARIRLASDEFDPYLIVRTPSGRQMDNDDIAPGNLHSGIDLPRTEAGEYQVIVTSYSAGETGAWVLSVEEGPTTPGPILVDGGDTGASTEGGRVFGVFAGITDYPAGVGDLPECANDAIKLSQTLREGGLLTEDRQVLLTDGQATLANVRAAMEQMAERVGPNDVFVFFYSGHGGRAEGRPTSDRREIDGADEYLVMHDGALIDDELGRLFDGISARMSVVALDACFAGGFAKDVITRPGRVGLFSSEEDVTSAVAGAFEAGGYLSHFLRMGVAGEADQAPRDSVLTVGELTHYLTVQFGRHVRDVRMSEGYQHLVVDRGAVSANDVMWAYR